MRDGLYIIVVFSFVKFFLFIVGYLVNKNLEIVSFKIVLFKNLSFLLFLYGFF